MKNFRVVIDAKEFVVKADDILQGYDSLTFALKEGDCKYIVVGQFKYWDFWSLVDEQDNTHITECLK